ncbi:MAG TPA: MBL fold metallo-hydrolase [Candidatus Thermoplasmatota archaeon]|nr:MBL fold metallo-hydrolase [Candidatus Thermoplasmatota archaeon]
MAVRLGDSNIFLVGGPLAFPGATRPDVGWDCNQFLVKDPGSNTYDLVDAGHGLDFEAVLRQVATVTDPHRIRNLCVSHEHLDHVNGLPHWKRLGCKIHASAAAARKLHEGRDPTSEMFGARIAQVDADRILEDGDHVRLGDRDFEVILTPGHSPGSACYWDGSTGTLFCGDTLFAEGGIGRFDFPDSEHEGLVQSIRRLAQLPVRHLHCGHGPSVEGAAAARSVAASLRHAQSYA